MNLQRELSDSDRLKLPPISIMDDFLPKRSWVSPILSSPDDLSLSNKSPSLPTPPQPDQWKSPPYKNNNELSRDTTYTYYTTTTSPIITSPLQQQQYTTERNTTSYFQYTSKAYHIPNRVDNDIEEVVRQCNTLCDNMIQRKSQFINSQLSASTYQDLTSTRPWLDDMIGRANEVLNALLRLRKHQMASEQIRSAAASASTVSDHQSDYVSTSNNNEQNPNTWCIGSLSPVNNIRQRKRGKRPAFQGRCHSCNISSTPEWRRGPDGARTLCNACGLHYAKLARKQQENRGMSSNDAGILGSNNTRLLSLSRRLSRSNTSLSTSPPDDIILDRSPTG